jgi:uncharacterized protein DUF3309
MRDRLGQRTRESVQHRQASVCQPKTTLRNQSCWEDLNTNDSGPACDSVNPRFGKRARVSVQPKLGYYPSGTLGTILLIVLILYLLH